MKAESVWSECRKPLPELFADYHRNPSTALRNKIAVMNDRLAIREAHRQKEICGVPVEDLEQYARIGLLKAVERFNPKTGHAFSSFAVPYIKGEIQHFLRDYAWDLGKVPRRAIETASQVRRTRRWAIAAGRHDVADRDCARSLGIDSKKWRQVEETTARKPVIDLDESVQVAAATDDEDAAHKEVRAAVAKLPNPYRHAIVGHYFRGLSEAAIAQQNSVAVEQVRAWLSEGLKRLQVVHARVS